MDSVTRREESAGQLRGVRRAWVYVVNYRWLMDSTRTRKSRVRSRRGGRSMNRGLIGTIIGVLVIIILVIVIMQLT